MTKDKITPFEIIDGQVGFQLGAQIWRGVSAYLLIDELPDCSVIITCPNEKILKQFWECVTKDKLDITLCKSTVGDYTRIEKKEITLRKDIKYSKHKAIKTIDKEGVVEVEAKEVTFYWYYDNSKDKCFICPAPHRNGCRQLGIAVRRTELECKILLRDVFKWDKEDIAEVGISLKVVEDIPF